MNYMNYQIIEFYTLSYAIFYVNTISIKPELAK